ncbi:MAG: hypothetical protein M1833_003780 [Piccolia ochrophora]|nr:MAG: hypothetical protein M1833_003780 [Piccolia ochrophora]
MSLNGLDDAKVDEAFQAAVAEPGAWFLLKYISRDEVDLLARGHGGVGEFREAIGSYKEESPLYGFLRYRRRTVLIKYIPEGTSRLLQARVVVHFQAVTEKFTPHDAVFSITAPTDLKETALSGACSLHTASASTSSSNSSLQQKRLTEIAEDSEETRTVNGDSSKPLPALPPDPSVRFGPDTGRPSRPDIRVDDYANRESVNTSVTATPTATQEVPSSPSNHSNQSSVAETITLARMNEERRTSTSSTRPATRDTYHGHSTGLRPKVKLGPRPSLDSAGRPQTSGSMYRQYEPRPVATLPAGIRTAPRKKSAPHRMESDQNLTPGRLPTLRGPVPETSRFSSTLPPRPLTSSGSIRSINSVAASVSSKSPAMTPEKQRLMKALQLRRQQQERVAEEKAAKDRLIEAEELQAHELQAQAANDKIQEYDVRTDEVQDHDPSTASGVETEMNGTPIENLESTREEISAESNPTEADEYEIPPTQLPVSSPVSPSESPGMSSTNPSSVSDGAERYPQHAAKPSSTSDDLSTKEEAPSDEVEKGSDHDEEKTPTLNDSASHADIANPHEPDRLLEDVPPNVGSLTQPSMPSVERQDEERTPRVFVSDERISAQETSPRPNSSSGTKSFSTIDKFSSGTETDGGSPQTSKRQRRPIVDPIRTDMTLDSSDDNLLSDDSLMDELNQATVQEAKPVSVRKSPMAPYFSPSMNERQHDDLEDLSRAVSSCSSGPSLTGNRNDLRSGLRPGEVLRSTSGTILSVGKSNQGSAATIKKVNVSSGISQRIKALEKFSSQSSPATPPLSNASTPRKSSLRSPPSGGSLNALPIMRNKSSPSASPSPSMESVVLPIQSAHQRGESASTHNVPASTPQPDSVSVKAQIVRNTQSAFQSSSVAPLDRKENTSSELHEGPITIERHTAVSPKSTPKSKFFPVEAPSPSPIPNSPSHLDSPSSPDTRRPSATSIQSAPSPGIGRAKSPPPSSNSSSTGLANGDESKDTKKESATSRFFRRMSSISNSSRKSLVSVMSPTLKEENPATQQSALSEGKRGSIDVGEVNVQFPDSLLWKWRCLKLDSDGNIVLGLSKADEVRKYPAK